MAKDVLITPAGGIVEFKDTGVQKASIYELNGDLYLDSTSGSLIFGDGTPTNVELGSAGVAIDFDFLGGGTITSSGNVLSLGASGDTVNLNVTGVTYIFPNTVVTTSDYTAADVLTKIKTVDGSGSGLDADLLDGNDSIFFTNASNLSSGTVGTARLGTGTANTTTWLRGDGSWQIGPLGYTGSVGSTGFTGSQGIQGVTGFVGSQGIQGVTGFVGSRGNTGFTGSQGANGTNGFTGSQGIQGITGFTGSQGANGTNGFTGSVGFTGSAGTNGTNGTNGFTGSQGIQGVTGFTGSQGIQGVTGFVGSKGDIGFVGSASTVIGFTGSVGFVGSRGNTGFTGSQGVSGFTGSASTVIGYSGSVGFTGSQGNQGVTGFVGSRGALSQWSVKTANYTAVDGDRFIAKTTAGTFTVTLPATPTTGAYVQITDGDNWFANNLLVARNGSTIEGYADDVLINISNVSVEFIYDGTTWQFVCSAGPEGPVNDSSAIIYSIALG